VVLLGIGISIITYRPFMVKSIFLLKNNKNILTNRNEAGKLWVPTKGG
jgi:hypothetical protein